MGSQTRDQTPKKPGGGRPFEFFTAGEAQIADAVARRIFPDGAHPGAREAGVVYFIDYMLSTRYDNQQAFYREGLGQLDRIAREHYSRGFVELSDAEKDSLLENMEARALGDWPESAEFFAAIRLHTIEGMLSDPKYRGNSGGTGWRGLIET